MSYESESIVALKLDVLALQNKFKGDKTTVNHIFVNQRYRIVVERAASTKGVDGFKCEVNGDDFDVVQNQIKALYGYAKDLTNPEQRLTMVDRGITIQAEK